MKRFLLYIYPVRRKASIRGKHFTPLEILVCKKRILLIFLTGITLLTILIGCATVPKIEEYVLPLPPDRPRLKWLYDLSNEKDLYPQRKMPFLAAVWHFLIGRETPDFVLTQPIHVCADGTRVYVTDVAERRLVVFDLAARKIYFWGAGQLGVPSGVAVDNEGRVYVADSLLLKINVYDRNGNLLYQFGKPGARTGELSGPQGIVINKNRALLYVLDRGNNRIAVFDLQGNFLYHFSGPGNSEGKLFWAQYLAIDKEGKIYVSDSFLRWFQIFLPEGNFLKRYGEPGDSPGFFARPKGIAVDSDGNIYVADAEFELIQIFNSEGKLNFFFYGVPPVRFKLPQGLYIDERDRLYVVDTLNRRIQVYQYLK